MSEPLEVRIMQIGGGWYWEAVDRNRKVIGRGITTTHAQARIDAAKISLPAGLQALPQIPPALGLSTMA